MARDFWRELDIQLAARRVDRQASAAEATHERFTTETEAMIVLSARQAEEANRDLAKIARMGNSGLMLVPVEARGTVPPSRTPRIHLSKTGEFLILSHR